MTSRRCLVCARQRARRWHESLGGVASSNDWSHRLQSSWSQYEETLASQILIWQQSWAACHIPLLLLLLLLLRDDEEDEDVDDDDDDADFLLLPISFRRQHIRPIYLCRWLHASHVINWADDKRQTTDAVLQVLVLLLYIDALITTAYADVNKRNDRCSNLINYMILLSLGWYHDKLNNNNNNNSIESTGAGKF